MLLFTALEMELIATILTFLSSLPHHWRAKWRVLELARVAVLPYSIFYGMCEFTDCPYWLKDHDGAPPTTTNELHLESPTAPPTISYENEPLPPSERFHFSNDAEMKELAEGVQPKNTTNSTKWALKVFELWCSERNRQPGIESVPSNFLTIQDPASICKYLSLFVVEARKKNGEKYPPSTIHQILCGLLRHMRNLSCECPNFLDKGDRRFKQLHNTLDAYFHNLHTDGIGIQVKHAEIITNDEEMKLWSSGEMGLDTPSSLQNAAFYTVGKMFCLRGGQEHRSLRISQLVRLTDPDRYVYHENTSKNRNGSFKQLHVKPKIVPIYAVPDIGERCPVNIIDKYLNKLPSDAFKKDLFYVRPLSVLPNDDSLPWYSSVPVGKNTLNNKIKVMCGRAKIQGNKTNHSLRATGATALFDGGVPEKVIQERTGHRSVDALRTYEHTSDEQHKQAASILTVASKQFNMTSEVKHQSMDIPKVPSISFGDLHGCTININPTPLTCATSSQHCTKENYYTSLQQ